MAELADGLREKNKKREAKHAYVADDRVEEKVDDIVARAAQKLLDDHINEKDEQIVATLRQQLAEEQAKRKS